MCNLRQGNPAEIEPLCINLHNPQPPRRICTIKDHHDKSWPHILIEQIWTKSCTKSISGISTLLVIRWCAVYLVHNPRRFGYSASERPCEHWQGRCRWAHVDCCLLFTVYRSLSNSLPEANKLLSGEGFSASLLTLRWATETYGLYLNASGGDCPLWTLLFFFHMSLRARHSNPIDHCGLTGRVALVGIGLWVYVTEGSPLSARSEHWQKSKAKQ